MAGHTVYDMHVELKNILVITCYFSQRNNPVVMMISIYDNGMGHRSGTDRRILYRYQLLRIVQVPVQDARTNQTVLVTGYKESLVRTFKTISYQWDLKSRFPAQNCRVPYKTILLLRGCACAVLCKPESLQPHPVPHCKPRGLQANQPSKIE